MSIQPITEDIEGIPKISLIDENKIRMFVKDLIKNIGNPLLINISNENIDKEFKKLKTKYHIIPSKSQLRYIYEKYFNNTSINHSLGRYMIKRAVRSRSGVLVSTIVLKPSEFSCTMKCAYCPTETNLEGKPTQPKSYLSSEPAMLRALQYDFDVRGQLWDRIRAYIRTGNIQEGIGSVKLEIILSGGTWEIYPEDYRNQVMTEIYWGANTYDSDRPIKTIDEEIKINETSKYRIIGLTIETRPDFIKKHNIKNYCKWGVTRVQIGVQHYNDDILKGIKRGCYTIDTIRAIRLLKQAGFKIVVHLMPDLPGSNPELDRWMFNQAITNPDLQFDDVKVYPTAVCQTSNSDKYIVKSDIADWYKQGIYTPYAEKNLTSLINVLKYYKINIQPWIRIQRLVRDIPKQSIQAGYEGISNLRQIIHDQMKREGTKCRCIRCMEIGENIHLINNAKLVVRQYPASQGIEYFISVESYQKNIKWIWIKFKLYSIFQKYFHGNKIYWNGNLTFYNGLIGFCRLRIDPDPGGNFIPELKNCALIREVHVYGQSLGVGMSSSGKNDTSQHKGFGQLLVHTAENIAATHNFSSIAVIAGVGTREYYKNKCGYQLIGTYMIKNIQYHKYSQNLWKNKITNFWLVFKYITLILLIFIFSYYFLF